MKESARIISALLLFGIFIGLFCENVYATDNNLTVSAKSAALYVPETDVFLYTKSSDQRMPMASTTKIMTALVTIENADLSDTVCIPSEAVGIEGSSAYLKCGEIITIEEMLYALLLQSANDVATALAYHIGGSIEGFSDMMNAKAESLGLRDTHFSNPHGLDAKDHYTTARELAIIAAAALKNDKLKEIVSTDKKSFITEDRRRTYINHNKLLHLYDGCIGVKTGFTKKSGRCLVGAAERDGLTFISVTLDAPSDWSDHKRMLDLGFSRLEKVHLCSDGEYAYEVPVIDGKCESVTVKNLTSVSIITEKDNHNIDTHVKLTRYIVAPVNEGEILGEVIFTIDGNEVGRTSLVAEKTVEKQKQKGFFKNLSLNK